MKFFHSIGAFALTLALCLALKENYPFSHYPMYSSFARHSYYVYVADSHGNPLPIESISSVRTGRLKKVYGKELKKVKKITGRSPRLLSQQEREPAGIYTLEWLISACKSHARDELLSHAPLQLYHVDIFLEDDSIRERSEHVATHP